ncbi:MAG: type II toxin-antitoxin system Phd/YefM family antitoxin [Gemmatimonadetes bacterium]|nr:type II toxin-antitoxin system Phd/YefM family antitoxin [Gemmatimonadota bacterium]
MRRWKLEEAKNRFSELVRRALAHGPQLVTRNGRDAVVVLSVQDYERLAVPRDLVDFLRQSPFADALAAGELDLERPRDLGRDLSLRSVRRKS